MSDYILRRTVTGNKGTLGILSKDGKSVCLTCEEPWRNNQRRISCIPAARYRVVERYSPKYGKHWHVLDVPGRDLILIHIGNSIQDTEGCILVGKDFSVIGGYPGVTDSRETMERLRKTLPKEFWLTVIDRSPE